MNTSYKFSFYKPPIANNKPEKSISLEELMDYVQKDHYANEIHAIRQTSDKKEYRDLKSKTLPYVTISGEFEKRKTENLISYSGLLSLDIDGLDNHASLYDDVFNAITEDEYTLMCFQSPGGNGIKVIIKSALGQANHKDQLNALQAYYNDHIADGSISIPLDSHCFDIARAMFLSWDENVYYNPTAPSFDFHKYPELEFKKENENKKSSGFVNHKIDNEKNFAIVEEIVAEIEQHQIDITSHYEDWFKISVALADTFGQNGESFFHRVSKVNPGYDYEKCQNQFNSALSCQEKEIHLGTFIWYAKQNGVTVSHKNNTQSDSHYYEIVTPREAFLDLKRIRHDLHLSSGWKHFYIFTNVQLVEILRNQPTSKEEFIQIDWVTAEKIELWSAPFITYFKDHQLDSSLIINSEELINSENIPAEILETNDPNLISLWKNLKELRKTRAIEMGKKSFQLLTDRVMKDLIVLKPNNKESFIAIKGLGESKWNLLGEDVVEMFLEND